MLNRSSPWLLTTLVLGALLLAAAVPATSTSVHPPAPATTVPKLSLAETRHILFYSIPFPGHVNPLLAMGHALVEKGYQVTVSTAAMMEKYIVAHKHPLIEYLPAGDCPAMRNASVIFREAAKLVEFDQSSHYIYNWVHDLHPCLFPPLFEGVKAIQKEALQSNRGRRPVDLIVVDASSPAAVDVANELNIPFVVNNPDLVYLLSPRMIPPVDMIPIMFRENSIHDRGFGMSLIKRAFLPVARAVVSGYIMLDQVARMNRLRALSGLQRPYDPFTMYSGRLIIQNTAIGLEHAQYIPPNIRFVGPCIQPSQAKLSTEDDGWMRAHGEAGPPVVFVSPGTVAPLSKEQLKKLLLGFVEAGVLEHKLRVLWKLDEPQQKDLRLACEEEGIIIPSLTGPATGDKKVTVIPDDALTVTKWVSSQTEILRHPNTAVFLSHCGINSAHETAWIAGGHVMMLCLPMFADQLDMAQRVRDAGLGMFLRKHTFTPTQVAESLASLFVLRKDSVWKKRGYNVRKAVRLAGGLDRAVEILEYAITTYDDKLSGQPPTSLVTAYLTPDTEEAPGKVEIGDFGKGVTGEGATGMQLLTVVDVELSWYQWMGIDVAFVWFVILVFLRFLFCNLCCRCCCKRTFTKSPTKYHKD